MIRNEWYFIYDPLLSQAVLRYLIRVFEIKGGSMGSHVSLFAGVDNFRAAGEKPHAGELVARVPGMDMASKGVVVGEKDDSGRPALSGLASQASGVLAAVSTKREAAERYPRGVGLIVHRTREVRFQCHRCGHFYSWEKGIRLHYEKVHREAPPADESLYVLPWEKKRWEKQGGSFEPALKNTF